MTKVAKRKKAPAKLNFRRDLIFHAYDSFLTAQTRIFTLANSTYNYQSAEIRDKQTILLLDDLVQFSIAARRLFDLTDLKDFSQGLEVPLAIFENYSEPKEIIRTGKTVGFRRIVNTIVHSKDIYFFHDRIEVACHFRKIDMVALYGLIERICRENRWAEYSLEPTIFVVSDVGAPLMVCLSDFISASTTAADKIVSACADAGFFLELEYRGGA